ncbi:MAG: acetyl-CoA carboxylase biotin carboxyl carrier protein subunit [Thaumarchaeota archaeon]|nr:acetyl-CoA carboxylase biotin carboxyl carrier protein subunit [Nitrososphaerota archaeon]MDE1832637.1 acetyl-CoA carboxylase biotin carboxyl carrier protein subunit [Nitrososphaerota archaeon]MDE1841868.1 acetyl-CoA carboxylase biotin carboxyl carrier protein subunit [Nitrososphaerota archaeon]MDE1878734.1 acetyl-CoA carboxylase biotin carboxyl carrier protein subunit [Nitrososphaerota archaeon]
MKFKLENTGENLDGDIVKSLGNNEFILQIKGKERDLKIITMTHDKVEFMLDSVYHITKYLENSTNRITLVVDGVKLTFNKRPEMDKIVYKNSGADSTSDSQINLKSQIPGRVVSINVAAGDDVKKGDVVCILESMKMQISIKSHKDGVVKAIKMKQGSSVAKNDVLAEIE